MISTNLKSQQISKAFKFEKIIFHTTLCFGNCPTYHLQVDNDKKIKLYAEDVYKNDSTIQRDKAKIGYFTGTVSNILFIKLTNALKKIGLDTLEFNGETCCDNSVITIIVYYNGKRKYLKSMFPPAKAHKLISTLYEICETSKLQRNIIIIPFEIEDDKTSR